MLKTEAYNNSILFLSLSKKNGYKAGVLYAYKGDGFIWDRNSTAYRTNSAGLLELMASDVPRVDYTNTCPEILIEKESENIILQSNSLDNSFSGVVGTNDAVAPDGTMTADSFDVTDSTNGGTYKNITLVNGNTYTYSVWLKGSVNGQKVLVRTDFNGDLTTFTLTTDWERYSTTFVSNSSTAQSIYLLNGLYVSPTNNDIYYVGDQQLESSDYATSYIPTTTTAVTRPQDIAYNTSVDVTGLVGTIFVRVRVFESTYAKTDTILSINDGTTDNYILIYSDENRDITISTYGNPDQNDYTYSVFGADGVYNIAVGYDFSGANNLINISIDGVQTQSIITQVNAPPPSLNRIDLGSIVGNLPQVDNKIIGVQWFNTQLDDSSLAALTTA